MRGWADHYQFCNDQSGFEQLEGNISTMMDRYTREFEGRSKGRNSRDRQRLLGVHVLSDSKRTPIVEIVHHLDA